MGKRYEYIARCRKIIYSSILPRIKKFLGGKIMSKLSKILTLGVALVMTISLAGCGQKKVSQNNSTKTETAGTTLTPTLKPEKPVKLSWYYVGGAVPEDQDAVNQAVTKYLKEKLYMNVDFSLELFTWANYKTQLTTMQAAREPFDLFFTSGGDYFTFARNGVLWELNDERLSKYAPDAKKALGDKLIKAHQVDNKLFALPANKDNASSMGLVFNNDLVKKYGFNIDSVKSYNDLTPMFETIKAKEPNVIPFVPNGAVDPIVYCNFQATSGNIANLPGVIYMNNDAGNTKVFNQFESAEMKGYIKLMNEWFKAGYISADNDTAAKQTSEGKVLVTSAKLKPGKDKEMNSAKVTFIQKELRPADVDITDIAGSMTAVSTTSKNPELALQVLNLAYKDPNFVNMLVFGIEGKHYTKLSEKVVEPVADSAYKNTGNGWRYGDQFLNYLKKGEDADKWDQFKKFNDSSKVLDAAGFSFDSTDVAAQAAALTNVTAQYYKILYTGQADPDKYLPEFIAKLKANGLDAFIAAQQKQLDAFLATKKAAK
jgi:putative aldouronate transport system substrate-binding protein